MSRNSFQVSTFDRELTSNYARYKCTSDTIRKTLKALGMARDSGGEISGIVEFSAGNHGVVARVDELKVQLGRPKPVLVYV